MDPISLRIRSAAAREKAREVVEETKKRRQARHAAYRALAAVLKAYALEERVCVPLMSAGQTKRWREEREIVWQALMRMTKLGWP